MSAPRLRTKLMVQAILRQAAGRGSFGAVVRRGDPDAGGVMVLLRARGGAVALLTQTRDASGEPAWLRSGGDASLDAAGAAGAVERAVARDPDLWVVEFDSDALAPPFEAILLAE